MGNFTVFDKRLVINPCTTFDGVVDQCWTFQKVGFENKQTLLRPIIDAPSHPQLPTRLYPFGWVGVVAQVRPGDARGAQDPADAQPLVQVVQGVDAPEGGRRVRGGDQLGSGVVHTRGDRPARRARAPAVQQGPAGAQVHGLSEGVVPQRQVHIHGSRRQSHRPLDHLAPSESLMFPTHPSSGLPRNSSTLTVDFLPHNLCITVLRISPAKTLPFRAKNSRTKSEYRGNNISLLNVRFSPNSCAQTRHTTGTDPFTCWGVEHGSFGNRNQI